MGRTAASDTAPAPDDEEARPLLVAHGVVGTGSSCIRYRWLLVAVLGCVVAASISIDHILERRAAFAYPQRDEDMPPLQMWKGENKSALCPGGNSLRWKAHPGKCVAVDTGEKFLGSQLYLWDCISGFPNQQFIVPPPGVAGPIRWAGDLSKCVDVQDGSNKDGTHLQLWSCFNGNMNQRFITSEGAGMIRWAKHPETCFNVLDGAVETGKNIVLFHCDSQKQPAMNLELLPAPDCDRVGRCPTLDKAWEADKADGKVSENSSPIRLWSQREKCMTVRGNGTLEVQSCTEGEASQQFLLPANGTGPIRWASHPESCLAAEGKGIGAAIIMAKCKGEEQHFAVADFPGPIRWVIHSKLCISLRLGSPCDGNAFAIRECDDGVGPGLKFDVQAPATGLPKELSSGHKRGDVLFTNSEKAVSFRPEVGNGFIATVVGSDTVFAAGVFNGCMTDASGEACKVSPSRRARIPAPLALDLEAATTGAALDLRGAAYLRYFEDGLRLRFYAHRSRRTLLVVELSADTDDGSSKDSGNVTAKVLGGVENPESDDIDWTSKSQPLKEHEVRVWRGTIKERELPTAEQVKVVVVFPKHVPKEISMKRGTSKVFLAAISTSLESADPETTALQDYLKAVDMTSHDLYAEHESAWADLWESGFEVSGRMDVARTVNSSLYFILSSLREDAPYSLSPGGLASNGYLGHSFWDAEMWMLPPLTLWHPRLSASLLEYRINRVGEAREKAKSYKRNWKGAMFPWESAATGFEECPTWAETGQLEQHITADIAHAQEQLWNSQHNETQLRRAFHALVKETADFWTSRVEWEGERARIKQVIPPDEYAKGDDSVFTNFAAKRNLLFAERAAKLLGHEVDPDWNKTAAAIPILFDEKLGIHPEYDGYSGGRVKQADTVLLGFPLMMDMPEETRRADLDYYAPKTSLNGPAMTWGMHAIGRMEIGEDANSDFNRAFANAQKPFYVWTETPSGGAVNFITGAGGFLQTAMYGLGGIRIWSDHLVINPTLLKGMTSVTLRGIHYRGAILRISYNADRLTIHSRNGHGLTAKRADNATVPLPTSGSIDLPMNRTTIWPPDAPSEDGFESKHAD